MIKIINNNDYNKINELMLQRFNITEDYNLLTSNNMYYGYVLEENNIIIGFLSFIFDGEDIDILYFLIDKAYEGKGYGTKLLNDTLNLIFKDRAKSCTLDVRKSNLRAINVYNKLGFKEIYVRKAYYNDGEDDIVMKKEF